MPPMQIVFLFDLDAYIEDNLKVAPDLSRKLVCLRLTCLKILSYYHTVEPNLKWGFKFFDSRGSLTQTMCKYSFPGVSLENFEILENEISLRYQRHVSYLDALIVSAQRNDDSSTLDNSFQSENKTKTFPIQVLQHALTQILYEYHWNNQMVLFSPAKTTHVFNNLNKNNILFLITKCPKNEENFSRYFGIDYASISAAKFSKTLLSQSLHEQLLTKSSIQWIWLNTNAESFVGELTPGILTKIAEMLKSLKCSLLPISVLSQPPHILKFEDNVNELLKMDLFNSLIPFSTIFSQSITFPFYLDKSALSRYSTIYFQDKELFVSLTKIPLQWSRNLQFPRKKVHALEEKVPSDVVDTNISMTWTKFVIHFALAKKFHFQTYDTYLCLPSVPSKDSNFKQFQIFSKSSILKNICLFMTCESSCGVKMPGLFSPISDTSALISILDINSLFKNKNDAHAENMKEVEPDDIIDEVLNNADKQSTATLFEDNSLSPFQMETLEHWYNPSASICEVTTLCKESLKSIPDLKAFYKKLAEKLKPSPEKENIAPNDDTNLDNSSEAAETYDVSDLSYDELITVLNTAYDSALKPGTSILQTGKRIVKSGFSFFQQKSCGSRSKEDLLRSFMTEFFYVSNRKIIEKYNQNEENDKMIRECQLQVLLILETEILVPSSEISNCINNVTSLLRSMSFYCGAVELNKFLHDVLKENYKDTLYDVLVEIGDELDIPLFEDEDDSFYEPSEPSSSVSGAASNNSQASALSVKSSTSSIELSRAGTRKLITKRSDIMDNSRKSRQILLTKSSPKKRKYKNLYPGAENVPTRFSPRLSSKRKRERNQKHISPGRVRRNLFPKDQKLSTPRYSQSATPRGKRRMRTPKAHHVLKTRFVAETPTAKQNRSALQRRKSFMDTDSSDISLTEIAESPKIVKSAKDSAHREILKKLTSLESRQLPVEQHVPNPNLYTQYTPESKRRLSLKLFSKLLTSPTARMGLKKCSKRLFEQVSPQIETKDYKKLKTDPEEENEIIKSPDTSPQQMTPETPK